MLNNRKCDRLQMRGYFSTVRYLIPSAALVARDLMISLSGSKLPQEHMIQVEFICQPLLLSEAEEPFGIYNDTLEGLLHSFRSSAQLTKE
jgi:hypothetical protein